MSLRSLAKFLPLAVLLGTAGTLVAQSAGADVAVDENTQRIGVLTKEADEANKIVITLQAAARKDKDSIRLSCINDHYVQLKALRNLFDTSAAAYDPAASVEDRTTTMNTVNEVANNIRVQREAAQACAGEAQLAGETQSDWTGPEIPDDPQDPIFPGEIEPPAYGSPFN